MTAREIPREEADRLRGDAYFRHGYADVQTELIGRIETLGNDIARLDREIGLAERAARNLRQNRDEAKALKASYEGLVQTVPSS